MSGPEVALAACRFVHDVATMLVWGASAYLAALVRTEFGREIGHAIRPVLAGATALAIATAVARLPLEVAVIGDGWRDVLSPAIVRSVLFETSVGRAWQAEAAAAAVLLILPIALPAGWRLAGTAAGSGLLLATLALTGHAVMQDGWLRVAHEGNDAAHVLAGGAWLGAMLPLLPILRALDDTRRRRDAGRALRGFSSAGHAAVAVVIATGILNTLFVLGGWPTRWTSPYQAMLMVKIALVGVMTALALTNRYVVVPRLAEQGAGAIAIIRRATIVEIALGVGAVGLVSVFGLLEPT